MYELCVILVTLIHVYPNDLGEELQKTSHYELLCVDVLKCISSCWALREGTEKCGKINNDRENTYKSMGGLDGFDILDLQDVKKLAGRSYYLRCKLHWWV